MRNIRELKWNEEYLLKFTYKGKPCCSDKNFMCSFEVKDEISRLKSLGAVNINLSIRKWN